MQAETGYLSLTGEPDGPPSRMGLSIVDLMTGLFAAFALVSGGEVGFRGEVARKVLNEDVPHRISKRVGLLLGEAV